MKQMRNTLRGRLNLIKPKMACREAIVETLVAFGLPVPLDETIDKAIEYGVKT